jgi:hypothetical protein
MTLYIELSAVGLFAFCAIFFTCVITLRELIKIRRALERGHNETDNR